jgi:transposase
VSRLNPAYVHAHAKASGTRVTTDAVSARHVADFLATRPEKIHYEQEDSLASLRRHWRFIEQLNKQRSALINQLEKVLYTAHPDLVSNLTSGAPAWVLKLLCTYPTAERLARARASTVSRIPYLTLERAAALVQAARTSVASGTDAATEHLVGELARQVIHLDKLIQQQKEAMTELLEWPEEVALLETFPGIGSWAAVGLLLEIQTVERFSSVKKMASFFGLHPAFKKSGDGITVSRMSKRGSARMRSLLFMITLNAVQNNAVIARAYAHFQEQGMTRMASVGACMHKVLRIIYGMLRSQRPFDVQIAQRHQHSPPANPEHKRDRRFQTFDKSAPISRRAQKRRQQKSSQGAQDAENGMSSSATVVPILRK